MFMQYKSYVCICNNTCKWCINSYICLGNIIYLYHVCTFTYALLVYTYTSKHTHAYPKVCICYACMYM